MNITSDNRPLTTREQKILRKRCENWSFSNNLVNGFIPLGNGNDEDGIIAYLPYCVLFNGMMYQITEDDVLTVRQVEEYANSKD